MTRIITKFSVVSLAAALAWSPALADEAGKFDYMSACASCHGMDGGGSGPVSEYLTIVVPPLTGLSGANDGVFPLQRVINIIDGRNDVRAHGSGMPVWGAVFRDPVAAEVSGTSPDYITRGRILAIASYIESIQK